MALNITVYSYLDNLHIGLTVDNELVPDVDLLARAVVDELDLQVGLLTRTTRKRR
jgi:hypothetical protein